MSKEGTLNLSLFLAYLRSPHVTELLNRLDTLTPAIDTTCSLDGHQTRYHLERIGQDHYQATRSNETDNDLELKWSYNPPSCRLTNTGSHVIFDSDRDFQKPIADEVLQLALSILELALNHPNFEPNTQASLSSPEAIEREKLEAQLINQTKELICTLLDLTHFYSPITHVSNQSEIKSFTITTANCHITFQLKSCAELNHVRHLLHLTISPTTPNDVAVLPCFIRDYTIGFDESSNTSGQISIIPNKLLGFSEHNQTRNLEMNYSPAIDEDFILNPQSFKAPADIPTGHIIQHINWMKSTQLFFLKLINQEQTFVA